MSTYCGSGFFLLMCVQLYKQNRYRDTEMKGYVEGVKSSSTYTIRAVMLYMSQVSKVHTGLSIQSYVTHSKGVESSSIYTTRAVMLCMSKVSKEHTHVFTHNFLNIQPIFDPQNVLES